MSSVIMGRFCGRRKFLEFDFFSALVGSSNGGIRGVRIGFCRRAGCVGLLVALVLCCVVFGLYR